jgi:hypothetical protein
MQHRQARAAGLQRGRLRGFDDNSRILLCSNTTSPVLVVLLSAAALVLASTSTVLVLVLVPTMLLYGSTPAKCSIYVVLHGAPLPALPHVEASCARLAEQQLLQAAIRAMRLRIKHTIPSKMPDNSAS